MDQLAAAIVAGLLQQQLDALLERQLAELLKRVALLGFAGPKHDLIEGRLAQQARLRRRLACEEHGDAPTMVRAFAEFFQRASARPRTHEILDRLSPQTEATVV